MKAANPVAPSLCGARWVYLQNASSASHRDAATTANEQEHEHE